MESLGSELTGGPFLEVFSGEISLGKYAQGEEKLLKSRVGILLLDTDDLAIEVGVVLRH